MQNDLPGIDNACCTHFVKAVLESKILASGRRWHTNECVVHAIMLTFCPFCGQKLPPAKKRRKPIKKDKSTLFDNQ
jgi:hypothetical protein